MQLIFKYYTKKRDRQKYGKMLTNGGSRWKIYG